jgi:hypothetical protein
MAFKFVRFPYPDREGHRFLFCNSDHKTPDGLIDWCVNNFGPQAIDSSISRWWCNGTDMWFRYEEDAVRFRMIW